MSSKANQHRCWGLARNFNRCQRAGPWKFFCEEHKRQPLMLIIFLTVTVGGSLASYLGAWSSLVPNPAAALTGYLTPQDPVRHHPITSGSWNNGFDGDTLYANFSTDVVMQPFGNRVPLSLKVTKQGLLVSAIVYSLDGKIVAEVIDNNWTINPNNYFRKNFDSHALEAIDQYNIPLLQIDYLALDEVRIGGMFRGEVRPTSELYPEFPSEKHFSGAFLKLGPGDILLLSAKSMRSDHQTDFTPDGIQKYISYVREDMTPWFDYTRPKKLGKRVK